MEERGGDAQGERSRGIARDREREDRDREREDSCDVVDVTPQKAGVDVVDC